MIGGVIKYYRFSYDYVLWQLSYTNINMLLATIPLYDSDDKKEDSIDAKETINKLARPPLPQKKELRGFFSKT